MNDASPDSTNVPLHALVLAGGSGTRFWPWSRRDRPKQFLPVDGGSTLLERTLERLDGLVAPDRRWILTRSDLTDSVTALLPHLPRERIVAEPEGRDTAPALVLGACAVAAVDPDALLLVVPSDHHIADPGAFRATVERAQETLLADDGLYTFGVTPTGPETGFGYIERGERSAGEGAFAVRAFREKPDRATAERYLADAGFLWNAGIFLWRARTFLDEIARVAEGFAEGLAALERCTGSETDAEARDAAFRTLPRISVDYALLERSDRVRVVEAEFPWDDVGSWDALPRLRGTDEAGNVTLGDTVLIDTVGSVVASGKRTVVVIGAEDLLVVETEDAILVCPRDRAQDVRRAVEELRARDREELL